MAATVAKRIRNARKMFKLLKFMDAGRSFMKGIPEFSLPKLIEANKAVIFNQTKTKEHIGAFQNLFFLISKAATTLYYLLDNTNLLLQAIFGRHHAHR